MQIQYPTWRYHASLNPRIVKTQEEDESLGKGWFDSPAAAVALVEDQPNQADGDSSTVRRTRIRKSEE